MAADLTTRLAAYVGDVFPDEFLTLCLTEARALVESQVAPPPYQTTCKTALSSRSPPNCITGAAHQTVSSHSPTDSTARPLSASRVIRSSQPGPYSHPI